MIRTLAAAHLLLAFVQPAAAQVAKPDELPQRFAAAMAANDAEAMAALYASDAIVMTPEGPVAGGLEQITQLFGAMMGQGACSPPVSTTCEWMAVTGAG